VTRPTTSSPLYSKKKSGSSSSATASSTKKVQVKLLQNVPGTGQAGEVILVTSAFFNNKLLPTHLAKMISDEQVEQERQVKNAKEQATDARAVQLKAQIEALPPLVLRRKVGPNGHLFGGVGPKMIMDLLGSAIPDDFWTQQKGVKITAMMDTAVADGPTKITGDIKSVGTYRATIALTKAHSATLSFVIAAEES
jgi:ribosomal protein L9